MSLSNPVKVDPYIGPSLISNAISKIKWRVLMSKRGDLYLHHLTLLSTDQGNDVLHKLTKEYEITQSWFQKAMPFLIPVLYTATLSSVGMLPLTLLVTCSCIFLDQDRGYLPNPTLCCRYRCKASLQRS